MRPPTGAGPSRVSGRAGLPSAPSPPAHAEAVPLGESGTNRTAPTAPGLRESGKVAHRTGRFRESPAKGGRARRSGPGGGCPRRERGRCPPFLSGRTGTAHTPVSPRRPWSPRISRPPWAVRTSPPSPRCRPLPGWCSHRPPGRVRRSSRFSVVVSGALVSVNGRLAAQEARTAEVEELLAAADTNMVSAPLGDGRAAVFASYDRDAAVLVVEGLPAAPAGMVYRMWWVDGGGPRPAGVLEPSGGDRHAGVADAMGAPDQLWVSLEPEGDVSGPGGGELSIDL
nr:anti-sigma factor [Nocardiopsis flavescens]